MIFTVSAAACAGPPLNRDLAGRHANSDVQRDGAINLRVFQNLVIDHGNGAARAFLGRLEHELDRAVELVAQSAEDLGRTHQDGRVKIVPAGVHHTGFGRLVGDVVLLVDRQRIHVGTHEERLARTATLDGGQNAGSAGDWTGGDAGGVERIGLSMKSERPSPPTPVLWSIPSSFRWPETSRDVLFSLSESSGFIWR